MGMEVQGETEEKKAYEKIASQCKGRYQREGTVVGSMCTTEAIGGGHRHASTSHVSGTNMKIYKIQINLLATS